MTSFAAISILALRLATYLETRGRTYELATVVTVRSYSCISGTTSEDRETGMPGSSREAISRTRRSCDAFANELMSDTVNASIFRCLSVARSLRNWSSSSACTTAPSAATRSCASMVQESGAMGRDLL